MQVPSRTRGPYVRLQEEESDCVEISGSDKKLWTASVVTVLSWVLANDSPGARATSLDPSTKRHLREASVPKV